jgi:hypothetical protein
VRTGVLNSICKGGTGGRGSHRRLVMLHTGGLHYLCLSKIIVSLLLLLLSAFMLLRPMKQTSIELNCGYNRTAAERAICHNVTLHVHTCSGRNRIIPLKRRPNTNCTPNKPATLQRNQLLICYAGTSLVHTIKVRCYDTG